MPDSPDSLTALRTAIIARLAASPAFADAPAVTILTEDNGDIEDKVNKALGKLKVVAVLTTPLLARGESRGAVQANWQIDFFENALLNRAQSPHKTAVQLVEAAFANLCVRWKPDGATPWGDLVFDDHAFDQNKGLLLHTLRGHAPLLLQ